MNNDFLEVAIEAAKASGRIQKRNLSRAYRVDFKGDATNLVTEVDLRCEQKILATIRHHFPDHGFFAEEGGETPSNSSYRWIIDPLDGTTNFTHGYPCFCTSIALEAAGQVLLGVVFDPIRKELFTAERGKGAFLNGEKIAPSKTAALSEALLVTGFPYDVKRNRKNFRFFKEFVLQAQAVRRDGSAALDLCYTAMGRFDGFWEFSLSSWDLAAGSLILTEAGGKVSLANGRPFAMDKGEILASNGRIHAQMTRLLRRGKAKAK